ncbi:MAG TPA: alpha/beta hydrolase [Gracilimonas sp.]|uniref:alpha/beta hydrolase family protein n=1 Tax=Gracilimonas sp. TaxID=1974203 RepID=UPI002D93B42E|nr:alpha/beta hydrolase [Gracilimonas sp.]
MKIASSISLVLLTLIFWEGGLNAQNISREQIVFRSGENVLSGTLVLPDSAENVPIIIFMGGMYEWGDFHPQREIFIEENLEAVFPRAGVGVFYYDPRGVGDSEGRWSRATLSDFAKDALAAVSFLKQRKEVDPTRIGIIGHGEDGWVAQIVAATAPEDVKFMVSVAGPTFDPTRQLINEYHSEYVCNGADSTLAYNKAVQKAQSHQNWVSMIAITKKWRHMKMKLGFDPAQYLKEITIPTLFLFGESDGSVYPSWAMEELNMIFPDSLPSNFTTYSIAGANHYFHVVSPCYDYDEESSNVGRNFSFRFKEVFQDWIFENL